MNEFASAYTRRAWRRPRIAVVLLGALVSLPAWSETGCEQVPEARRAQCERMLECMAIDDADVRRTCIDAAQRLTETPLQTQEAAPVSAREASVRTDAVDEREPAAEEPAVVAEEPAPVVVAGAVSAAPATPAEDQAPVVALPAPVLEERAVASRQRASDPPRQPAPAEISHLGEPAAEFSAAVARIHQSVMDRQLIALDNGYLFVSDQGRQARLAVGQQVDVRQARSRFRSGRTWRLIGPSRRPIDAFRIRCESDDIGANDRRRCAQMLDW